MAWIRQEPMGWVSIFKGKWRNFRAMPTVSRFLRRSIILRSLSVNPRAMYATAGMVRAITFGASALTRTQEEAIAVAVSATNKCRH